MSNIEHNNLSELISKLRNEGIYLFEENGKLKYKSNIHHLNKQVLNLLSKNKERILQILNMENKISSLVKSQYENSFPLTEIQLAYIMGKGDFYKYGNTSCHVYIEVVYPKLDRKKVEKIWGDLVFRHEMLRVVFDSLNYTQKITKNAHFTLFDNCNENESYVIKNLSHKIYKNEKYPLFDIALLQIGDQSKLILSFDMMIADWRSIWILIEEFETLYFTTKSLSKIEYSFKDYVNSEIIRKQLPKYYTDKSYWIEKIDELYLTPEIEKLSLETVENNVRFTRYKHSIDKEKWEKIKLNGQKFGITASCTLLTIYSLVISQYSTNKKFAINCTVMDRDKYGKTTENLVGDFTNIMLLGVDFSKINSFKDYSKSIQNNLVSDLEHSSFSGIDVLREIRRNGKYRNNIYPYVFTSSIGTNSNKGLTIGKYNGNGISQTPQVFIDCQVTDFDGKLYINWDVRDNIFKKNLLEEMFNLFINIIEDLLEEENWGKSYNTKNSINLKDSETINKENYNNLENFEKKLDIEADILCEESRLMKKILKEIWSDLLVKNIEETADLFINGADSLLIAQASSKFLNELISKDIDNISFDIVMKAMLSNSSINEIVEYIIERVNFKEQTETEEVQYSKNNIGKVEFLRKGNSRDLIIIVHSGLGSVDRINHFTDEIFNLSNQDILTIEIGNKDKFLTLDNTNLYKLLGEEYCKLINNYRYESIHLIGHCIGGMISCELARELLKTGFDVDKLSVIDSIFSTNLNYKEIIEELLFLKMLGINFHDISCVNFKESELKIYIDFNTHNSENFLINKKIERALKSLQKISQEERFEKYFNLDIKKNTEFFKMFEIFKKFSLTSANNISPILTDIDLYLAEDENEIIPKKREDIIRFWNDICVGEFNVINIRGNHISCIENKENAVDLAKMVCGVKNA